MAYYAYDGGVGRASKHGAVEISQADYKSYLADMVDGKLLAVVDGVVVIDPPEPVAPELTLAEMKQDALSRLDGRRKRAERSGIVVAGMTVRTDFRSQQKLQGAVASFEADADAVEIDWQVSSGEWVKLNEATLKSLMVAVFRHVEATYTNKKALDAALRAAASVGELNEVDIDEGWPR